MIKKELIQAVSDRTGKKQKDVKEIFEASVDVIKEAVADDDKVSIVGFGVFEKRKRAEKKGTNPSTKKPMVIPSTNVPIFRPGESFKGLVK